MQDLPSLPSMLARLRFRQLQFLTLLAELGSLHKVAERMEMTQPGATRMLREIETTFGRQLFLRSKRGMRPNELGDCVVRYARLTQSDLGQLRDEIAGVLAGQGARVSVGAIGGAVPAVLVPALTLLRSQQPALSIHILEGTSAGLLAALDEGRLDLAICRTTVAAQPARYDYEHLHDERVAVAVGPQHPLARAAQVTLAQLLQHGWILYPSAMPLRSLLERELIEAGLPFPTHTTETASIFVTILMLQEKTQPVALLTAETMAFCRRHKLAVQLPLAIKARAESYGIVTRHGGTATPAASLLAQALRTVARRDAAGTGARDSAAREAR